MASDIVNPFTANPTRQFSIVNSGAHRKPSPLVGAPALILHYSLWRPDCAEQEWHDNIDYFLYCMFRKIVSVPTNMVSPNYDHETNILYLFRNYIQLCRHEDEPLVKQNNLQRIPPNERNVRHDVFSVRTTFLGLSLTVRAELFSEFWTLDFITDFDNIAPPVNPGLLSPYLEDFEYLHNFIIARYKREQGEGGGGRDALERGVSREDLDHLKMIRQSLHKRFRDLVAEQIVGPCCCRITSGASDIPKLLGITFAEFHGAVFALNYNEGAKDFHYIKPTRDARSPTLRRSIPIQVGNRPFTPEVALRLVDAMWPVIREIQRRSDSDEQRERDHGKPEFTVSRFQGDRSLYVSSLGWLDPQTGFHTNRPVVYTIVVSYRSRWSLGRLIDRIHSLGSLRLAALWEIENVTDAGDALKQLEDDLRVEERKLSENPCHAINGEHFARECLKIGTRIKYGLMHRVERSRYYRAQFERHLAGLRIEPVEGFQIYSRFVERRMYGTFDYIERVGSRYRELRQQIELILRSNSANTSQQLLEYISTTSQMSEMIQTNISGILKGLQKAAGETEILQEKAEYIILIPLVYYLGHVVSAVHAWAQSYLTANLRLTETQIECAGYILALLITFGLKAVLERKARRTRARRQAEELG